MAKSKSKLSKIKVPKRVAGVKIPKTVRKGPVMDFVNSSTGRMLIAEGLTAAVALFAYKNSDSPTAQKLKDGVAGAEDRLKRDTARFTFAFGEGVRAFREALAQPAPDGGVELDDTVGDDARDEPAVTAPSKKKPRSSARNEPSMPGGL